MLGGGGGQSVCRSIVQIVQSSKLSHVGMEFLCARPSYKNLSRGRGGGNTNYIRYTSNIQHSFNILEHNIIQYTIINVNHNYLLPLDLFIY